MTIVMLRVGMMRAAGRLISLFLIVFLGSASTLFAEGRRIALVVGNNDYKFLADLGKATNDARAVGRTLREIGFDVVVEAMDVNLRQLNDKVKEFSETIEEGDTAFLFYAGHGVAVGSVNYLLPTDFPEIDQNEDENVILDEAKSADAIMDAIQERKPATVFVVLDACRENPFKQVAGRSIGRDVGLAGAPPPRGVFMLFSAGARQVALDALSEDDPDENSVFTRKLIPLLKTPGISQVKLAKTLQTEVAMLAKTIDHDQIPSYYDEIPGEVYLNQSEGTGTKTETDVTVDKQDTNRSDVPPVRNQNNAAADWAKIANSKDKAAFEAFLSRYSHDPIYKLLAEAKIAMLVGKPDINVTPTEKVVPEEKITPTERQGFRAHLRSRTAAAEQCYALAGEPGSEPGFAGVIFQKIDVRRAIDACSRAIEQDPADSMLFNMLGRAHDAERNFGEAQRFYQKAVDLGNAFAYANLAWMMIYGNGVAQDTRKGMDMLQELANIGNPYALASLGWIHREGYGGTPRDYGRAFDYYIKAADQDYANAETNVAWFYREGMGVERNYERSFEYYRRAAMKGEVNAMGSLGYALQNGLGVSVNFQEARYWYEKGVEQNDAYSESALAWLYREGKGVPQDYGRALELYRRAAAKNDATAMASLGYMSQNGLGTQVDYREAIQWYEKAASQNDAYALSALGWMYREAIGVPRDYVRSLDYYKRAAELGDLNAMGSLGYALQHGLGTPVNLVEARNWYQKAAERNDAYSMASLAWLYESGNAVPQDYAQAKYWYERAALAGNYYAMGNLSLLIDRGLGTSANPREAARWAMAALAGRDANFVQAMRAGALSYTPAFRREMQRALQERGLYSGALDGVFGSGTAQAIDNLVRFGN